MADAAAREGAPTGQLRQLITLKRKPISSHSQLRII